MKKITKNCGRPLDNDFGFKYYSESQFLQLAGGLKSNIDFSVFHINIRSLNANQSKLIQLLSVLEYDFDVIILSELWSYNIEFYNNILIGYSLYTDLAVGTQIGGIGIFVKNCFDAKILTHFNIQSSDNNKLENLWLEVRRRGRKFIVGGCYRHPNQSISEFNNALDKTLSLIAADKTPIFAGDLSIDLLK